MHFLQPPAAAFMRTDMPSDEDALNLIGREQFVCGVGYARSLLLLEW